MVAHEVRLVQTLRVCKQEWIRGERSTGTSGGFEYKETDGADDEQGEDNVAARVGGVPSWIS